MSYDPGALNAALAQAVGDSPALVAELTAVFRESAERQIDLMARSRCDANWRTAARRLKGVAASFGAVGLVRAAQEADEGAPGDPVALRRVREALTAFGR